MKRFLANLIVITMLFTMPGILQTEEVKTVQAADNVLSYGDFSGGSFVGNNLYFSANHTNTSGETYTSFETKAGRNGIRINRGKYAYFHVLNDVITSNDRKIAVAITYYDDAPAGLFLEYNAADGSNYRRITAPGEEANSWRTVTLYIDDASFHRGQNNAGDFRISSSGSALISKVELYKHTKDATSEPALTLHRDTTHSEFTGKSFAGYQGWFGIGGQYSSWNHYAGGSADPDGTSWPRKDHISIDYFPDVTEFDESSLAQTGFANLGNGNPTKLYKSNTDDVIDVHFGWMEEYGIDGVAVQRFLGGVHTMLYDDPSTNFYTRIKTAAENHNRLFYVMYDLSGGEQISDSSDTTSISPFVKKMEFDWVYNIEQYQHLTESTAYATVNGKPVVCVYGLGIGGRPDRMVDYKELINFFHARGCYVIVGTSRGWRSQQDYLETTEMADMISPWMVGVMQNQSGIDYFYDGSFYADVEECRSKGIGYQPVIYSGFSWGVWAQGAPNGIPRNAGQFLWYQAYKVKQKLGLDSVFVAVFDEFDEGTAFAKNASDYFDIPTDQYFVTASCDGYWLSSDFQLRTVGEAIKMVKGEREAVTDNPVPHSLGPVYYRNSFEKRYLNANQSQYSGIYPIDPCFKNDIELGAVNATATVEDSESEDAKTGEYVASISGTATDRNASYIYRISETKIEIQEGMKLSYSLYADNELGRNVYVDLIDEDGNYISTEGFAHNGIKMGRGSAKGSVGQWTDYEVTFGTEELAGKSITGIALCYAGGTGDFTAYVDNVILEDGDVEDVEIIDAAAPDAPQNVAVSDVKVVSWSAVSDAEFYNVYVNGTLVGSTDKTTFDAATALDAAGEYTVSVSAQNNDAESAKTSVTYTSTDDVFVDYTSGSLVAENMRATVNTNSETEATNVTVRNVNAIHFDRYKYGYFRTLNNRITQDDNNLLLEVTYYDEGTGNISIQYNSLEGGNYKSAYITRTNTNRWKTKTIELTDASFKHAQNNGGDFRIFTNANEGFTVSRIAVKKQLQVSSDFTTGDYVGENMNAVINKNGETDGATYVVKNDVTAINIAQSKYAYFRVLNDAITRDDHNLIIEFTYFDEGTGGIQIQYNAIGNNYKDYRIQKTNTGEWKTEKIALTDAEFKKGQVNGADFRLRAGGTEGTTISSIVIKRMPIEDTMEEEPLTYTVTLDGTEVATFEEGETYALPALANVGYYGDGKLYKGGSTYTVTKDVEFSSVNLRMSKTPNLKYVKPAGLRFSGKIACEDEALFSSDSIVESGLLITPNDYLSNGSELSMNSGVKFTKITTSVWVNNVPGSFATSFDGIIEKNYERDFVSRGYMIVEYADGSRATIYSAVSTPTSVSELAYNTYRNKTVYNTLSEDIKALIMEYAGF